MLSVNVLISIAIFGLIGLVMILFLLPATSAQKIKKERPPQQLPKEKDWQDTALKLERYAQSLKRDIEAWVTK